MAPSSGNAKLRRRIETGLRILSPLLDLTLAAGERLSGLLTREDPDYVPARMPHEGASVPRGLRIRRGRPPAAPDRRGAAGAGRGH